MTFTENTTDRLAWDAALASVVQCERESEAAVGEVAEEAAYRKWADAWINLMRSPAPDIRAVAVKLELLIKRQFATHLDDDVRDPMFLQRLLDAPHLFEGEEQVLLFQDALRLSGVDHPVAGLASVASKPWHKKVAAYRVAVAEHTKLYESSDDAEEHIVQESHCRLRPLYNAILAYTPTDAVELAEKAELLTLDTDDHESHLKELKTLAADARRLAEACF